MKKRVVGFLITLIASYIGICLLVYIFQEALIFHPNAFPDNFEMGEIPGVEIEEVFWENGDAKLHGFHFKVQNPKGCVLYFHGNAGNVVDWADVSVRFIERGYDVILPDFRGYGKSTGTRTQEGLYSDARVQYDFAKSLYGEDSIVLYGRSMGSGMAVYVASTTHPKRVILETPYYSVLNVSSGRFPWLPVSKLLRFPLPSYQFFPKITSPVNIVHGTKDGVIPYAHSIQLKALLPEDQVSYLEIEGGSHGDLENYGAYHQLLDDVLGTKIFR